MRFKATMSPSASTTLLVVSCALLFASASAMPISSNHTLRDGKTCALFAGDLPQYCTCADGANAAATLTCSINPLNLDQMSFAALVQPCNSGGATLDLAVHDTKFNVSYAFPEFAAQTKGSVPVPGKSNCRIRAFTDSHCARHFYRCTRPRRRWCLR